MKMNFKKSANLSFKLNFDRKYFLITKTNKCILLHLFKLKGKIIYI